MAGPLQAGRPACGSCLDDADKIDAPASCQGSCPRCVLSPPRDPVVEEEPRGKQAAAPQLQRAAQTAATPQPLREAPAAAPQPPAKKPAPRAQLFDGAPAPVPAAKPKTRGADSGDVFSTAVRCWQAGLTCRGLRECAAPRSGSRSGSC
eukprot:174136-Pleurochrysis_carterae.AAC.1